MAKTGRLLVVGETGEYDGSVFTVERTHKRRILRISLFAPGIQRLKDSFRRGTNGNSEARDRGL